LRAPDSCIGVYSTNSDLYQVVETMAIGLFGYLLLRLGFHPAPIMLELVLGLRFGEDFRRALIISRGDLRIFIERPMSAVFLALCIMLIAAQIYATYRARRRTRATVAGRPA
jgi:putative tricarboxylic transport membrane protein